MPLDNGGRGDSDPSRKIAQRPDQGEVNKHLLHGQLARAPRLCVPTRESGVSVFEDAEEVKTKKGLFTARRGNNGQEASSLRVSA